VVDLCNIVNKLTGCEASESISESKDPKARYARMEINLYTPLVDKEYHWSGSFIGVAAITGGATCTIKLDYLGAKSINLREVQQIKGNFDRIYLTTDGEGGILHFYICQSMETVINPDETTVFSGTVRSCAKNSQNYVRRISETYSYKANQLKIRNTHAVNGVDIGYVPILGDLPSAADFRDWGWRLVAQEVVELSKVDLRSIGYVSAVDDASAHLRFMSSLE